MSSSTSSSETQSREEVHRRIWEAREHAVLAVQALDPIEAGNVTSDIGEAHRQLTRAAARLHAAVRESG